MVVMTLDFGVQMNQMEDEEAAEDDEDMGVAETYADYMPSKCKFVRLENKISGW